MSTKKHIYKIIFFSQGQLFEIYAKNIAQGTLFGFIEIEDIVFDTKSKVVLDPSEERLKAEFKGVKRTYLPLHSIVRIDEVDKEGTPKITVISSNNISPFPSSIYTPTGKEKL